MFNGVKELGNDVLNLYNFDLIPPILEPWEVYQGCVFVNFSDIGHYGDGLDGVIYFSYLGIYRSSFLEDEDSISSVLLPH